MDEEQCRLFESINLEPGVIMQLKPGEKITPIYNGLRHRRTCFYCRTVQYDSICVCCGAPEVERTSYIQMQSAALVVKAAEKRISLGLSSIADEISNLHLGHSSQYRQMKRDAEKFGLVVCE